MTSFSIKEFLSGALITGFIVLLVWLIITDYNNTREYIITNECDLTGNIKTSPSVWCDSNNICYYDEYNNYEYYCKIPDETKWSGYRINRNEPV